MPPLESNFTSIRALILEQMASTTSINSEEEHILTQLLEIINSCVDASDFITKKERILEVLRYRAASCLNTAKDFIINPPALNSFWSEFARKCSDLFGIPLIFLLIPTLTDEYKVEVVSLDLFGNRYNEETLNDLFLLSRGKYLGSINALHELWHSKKEFYVHRRGNDGWEPRPLTLTEMASLSLKTVNQSLKTKLLFELIDNDITQQWLAEGVTLQPFLYTTFLFLQEYFEYNSATDPTKKELSFNSLGKSWEELQSFLLILPMQDVYHFYAESIGQRSGKPLRVWRALTELYLNIQLGTPIGPEVISALCQWLAKKDLSFIFNQPAIPASLDLFYKNNCMGKYFTAGQLNALLLGWDGKAAHAFRAIAKNYKEDKNIPVPPKLLEQVMKVVENHWTKLTGGKEKDYTWVASASESHPWIKLLQILAGANLIPKNWYASLMPNSGFDELDPLFNYPTNCFPLTWYAKRDNLHYDNLWNVAQIFFYTGTLQHAEGSFFSKEEAARIVHADPRFSFLNPKDEVIPTINSSTLTLILDFINNSLFPEEATTTYSKMNQTKADEAFSVLQERIESLDETERNNLYAQKISWGNTNLTFKEWINRGQKKDQFCIASVSKRLVKLVLDYYPGAEFSPKINNELYVSWMRDASKKRICRDYSEMDSDVIRNFAQWLIIALLTHPYKNAATYKISFLGFTNTVDIHSKSWFEILQRAFGQKPSDSYAWVFAQISEANKSLKDVAHNDTVESWLKKVVQANYSIDEMANYFVAQMSNLITPTGFTLRTCTKLEKARFNNFMHQEITSMSSKANWNDVIDHLYNSLSKDIVIDINTNEAKKYLLKIKSLNDVLIPATQARPQLQAIGRHVA